MEATRTFLIEASREGSIESRSGNNSNNSSWTNQLGTGIHLKKGDNIQVSTSIVNMRGANGNDNLEITDGETYTDSGVSSNKTLINVGFYLCHNSINSVTMPYYYTNANGVLYHPHSNTTSRNDAGDNLTNNNYGSFNYANPLRFSGKPLEGNHIRDWDALRNYNPYKPTDATRHARVGINYNGWVRPEDGKIDELIDLYTQDVPIEVPIGFQNANAVGEIITNQLRFTQGIYDESSNPTPSLNFYKRDLGQSGIDDTIVKNPVFSGYCNKVMTANLQPYNDGTERNGLYNNLFVENPFIWKYGSQILSNTDTFNLKYNINIRNDLLDVYDKVNIDYPCFLWCQSVGGDVSQTTNYDRYSPHKTKAKDKEEGEFGQNVEQIQNFSGTMIDYNDYYGEMLDYTQNEYQNGQYGVYLSKTNEYYVIHPSDEYLIMKDPTDANKNYATKIFTDNDNTNFDRNIIFNRFNNLNNDNWTADKHELFNPKTENWIIEGASFEVYTDDKFDFQYLVIKYRLSSVTSYLYNITENDFNEIKIGEEYTVSFKSSTVSGSGSYPHAIGFIPRSAYGFNGLTVTSDGTHTTTFTATADYVNGANNFFTFYTPSTGDGSEGIELHITDFSIKRTNLQEGDTYTIDTIFHPINETTTKIYEMTINNNNIKNYKVDLSGNTYPSTTAQQLAGFYGVDYNRRYTPVGKFRVYKTGNFLYASTNYNANNIQESVLLINQDEENYTYWMYNQYGSTLWVCYRTDKFEAGFIENNTSLGEIQSLSFTLKNTYQVGQQYYDFSVGNPWTGTVKNVLKTIPNPFDTTSTFTFDPTGADVHYSYYADDAFEFEYLSNETATWKYVQSILTETVQANETFTISFDITNVTNAGNPLSQPFRIITSYLEGSNYYPRDFQQEGNHTFTFTTQQAPFNQNLAIYWGFYNNHPNSGDIARISNFRIERQENIDITSHISQTLPTVDTGAVAGVCEYFASFNIHVSYGPQQLTLYMGATNNGEGDETDKQGKRGRLIWDDGGVWNATSWDWNGGNHIDLDIDGGLTITYQGTAPSITNIVSYDTWQNQPVDLVNYSLPLNGRDYRYSVIGTTSIIFDLHLPIPDIDNTINTIYLAPTSSRDVNVYDGKVFTSIDEDDVNNAVCDWIVKFNSSNIQVQLYDATSNEIYLSVEVPELTAKILGWYLTKMDKYDYNNILDNYQILGIQSNEHHFITQASGLTGDTGRYIPDGNYTVSGDTGKFSFLENQNLKRYYADLEKHTLLLTNIRFNIDNIKIIENWFRYNEVYTGEKVKRTEIKKDIENFFISVDAGRTDENKVDWGNLDPDNSNSDIKYPQIPYYMRDKTKLGTDEGDNDSENIGCVCPRMKVDDSDEEQRFKIYTRFKDNWNTRLLADKRLNTSLYPFAYGNNYDEFKFKNDYPELYEYITTNNVGVYPYLVRNDKNTPTTYEVCCGFELFQDYNNYDNFKIQDLTYFGFSPSFFDYSYILGINRDTPAYNFTNFN